MNDAGRTFTMNTNLRLTIGGNTHFEPVGSLVNYINGQAFPGKPCLSAAQFVAYGVAPETATALAAWLAR